MNRAPTFAEIFEVMAAASSGDTTRRVELSEEPDLEDAGTRFAIALNILLDDLAFRIAEREQVEERLRQSQKMEAIGSLAGGVAHDFNNLLTVIIGYTGLALNELDAGTALAEDLREVLRAGERARELTQQLLAFGRKQILEPKVFDMNPSLLAMEKMLKRLIGEGIELRLELGEGLGQVKADPGQLEQIVMNLVANAKDALREEGTITLQTANIELSPDYAAEHPEVMAGPYVMLAVSDTGEGMDARVRERIFEPFFTTKALGKGTGLGLATVFGIVRQSGGHILVSSEPGWGTTFRVYLPRVDGGQASVEQQGPARRLQGSETVLVVEDDDQVRALSRLVLGRNGYNVLEAPDAAEATRIAESYAGSIDLMLTDVVMPKMSGQKLAQKVAPLRPAMKVLFMSGYADDAIAHHGVLGPGTDFLQKPITPESLLSKVRDLLDRR